MYVGIDIGGSKVLVGLFDENGVLTNTQKFETPDTFEDFIARVAEMIEHEDIVAIGVSVPGSFDRETGLIRSMTHIPWKDVALAEEFKKRWEVPVKIQNDANLGGLSEAHDGPGADYDHLLYITISTGIGTGIIINKQILPALERSEGGHIPSIRLSGESKEVKRFEEIVSGSAIKKHYGKYGYEINDPQIWDEIAHDLSLGIAAMMNLLQPDVIVFGGGIGVHFEHFEAPLVEYLQQLKSPLYDIPPIFKAKRAEEAVLYGCYLLARGL